MKVVSRQVQLNECPPLVASFGFCQPRKVRVTVGREYIVYAISMFRGVCFFQVVDDLEYPAWYPSWFFEKTDMSLPSDWICNFQRGDLALVIGPEFIAKDEESYNAMVQLEPEPVRLFWERAKTSCEE